MSSERISLGAVNAAIDAANFTPDPTGQTIADQIRVNAAQDGYELFTPAVGASSFSSMVTLVRNVAATPVIIIPDSAVEAGKKVRVHGWAVENTGGTWTGVTDIFIEDTLGTKNFVTLDAVAADILANVKIHNGVIVSGTPAFISFTESLIAPAPAFGIGLQVKANSNGASGGNLDVLVWGCIA